MPRVFGRGVSDKLSIYGPYIPVKELAVVRFDGSIYLEGLLSGMESQITKSGPETYRQIPALGTGLNLVKNGAFHYGGTGWTLHANASVVADSTSPTGNALRTASSTIYNESTQSFNVEPGKSYSFAAQLRSDGSNFVIFGFRWRDASGTVISATNIATPTAASWAEYSLANIVSPGNARTVQVFLSEDPTPTGNIVCFATAIRVKQQTTAPAAWSAADQVLFDRGPYSSPAYSGAQQGLSIYESTTNLLTNGDIESDLSGTVNAFDDQYADGNAWTPALPAPAANIVTLAAGTTYVGGHAEWWGDGATGSKFRWEWSTGGTMFLYVRYVDANNYVQLRADGAEFRIHKMVAGAETVVANAAAVLTTATFYWFTWSQNGTSFTASVNADAAGALGAAITTHSSQTISDAAVQTAKIAQGCAGVNLRVGGNFADVCLVKIAAPPGYIVGHGGGTNAVAAYCVSKTTKFSGTYSLSVHSPAQTDAWWAQDTSGSRSGTGTWTISGRVKTSSITGAEGAFLYQGNGVTPFISGTNEWTVYAKTETFAVADNSIHAQIRAASGTAWFDLLGLEQKAYNTLNSGDGQEYTTGTRAASSIVLPLPNGFSLDDFCRVVAVRLDHAYNGHGTSVVDRVLWTYFVDGSNYVDIRVRNTDGAIILRKTRAAVELTVDDGAATAFAAGDTVVVSVRHSATVGLEMQISKNGGAVATYTNTTPEAKLTLTGTPTAYLGQDGNGTGVQTMTGTIGIDRTYRPGMDSTTIQSILSRASSIL